MIIVVFEDEGKSNETKYSHSWKISSNKVRYITPPTYQFSQSDA